MAKKFDFNHSYIIEKAAGKSTLLGGLNDLLQKQA